MWFSENAEFKKNLFQYCMQIKFTSLRLASTSAKRFVDSSMKKNKYRNKFFDFGPTSCVERRHGLAMKKVKQTSDVQKLIRN